MQRKSNAKEDFPDPESPVITVNELRGITTSTFFRLCTRAPHTHIFRSESKKSCSVCAIL